CGLLILDSACGHPKTLCEIAHADLQFIVPLRAQTGFRERFLTDVGHGELRALRYVSQREHKLPAQLRTRYRGALRSLTLASARSARPSSSCSASTTGSAAATTRPASRSRNASPGL